MLLERFKGLPGQYTQILPVLQILKSAEEGVEIVVCSGSMSGERKTSCERIWNKVCS